ncbi:MAG: hypothetical protein AAB340_00950 [Patescibacteria group bacterium]
MNALVKILGPENIPGILDESLTVQLAPGRILRKVLEPTPITGTKKFVATKEIFEKEANVGDSCFWGSFGEDFFGKVEQDVPDADLIAHELQRNSVDAPIIKELGELHETTLWHFFAAMKTQSQGQKGILLINGRATIFYVRNKKGVLRAVGCQWFSDCRVWRVLTVSVERVGPWVSGYRVVSRNS